MLNLVKRQSVTDLRIPHNADEIKKRIKIVVIDDDKASFPTELLKSSGYTIDWWEKVDDRGLERLERNDFDIIILDINDITPVDISPEDGIGILKRIKNVNPAQIVVAFSGQEYNIEKTSFFKMADDTLSKPVNLVKAKDLIDRIIDQKITVAYFFNSLKIYLQKEGVKGKQIRKLEAELVKSINNNKTINYATIGDKILKGVEISSRVIMFIQKFLLLVGYNNA